MATLSSTSLTLVDYMKRLDPDDKIASVIELLHEDNEILDDMMFKEGNQTNGNITTVRTGLPTATWRLLNYGVQPSKSTTAQVTDTLGTLEAYSEIDKRLADMNGNTAAFRMSEDTAFLEAMNQEMAETLFYGTAADTEKFVGFAARYSTLSTTVTDIGYNIIDGGGTGSDNTSIWLVCWGDRTMYGIYGKGMKAGFEHEDMGQQTLQDAAGGNYEGYRSHYKWEMGLTVRDWRYAVRLCNIDWSLVQANDGTSPDLITLMIRTSEQLKNRNAGKCAWYMRSELRTYLRLQKLSTTNVNLTEDTVEGKLVVSFDGIPVRVCDQLLFTEARVV